MHITSRVYQNTYSIKSSPQDNTKTDHFSIKDDSTSSANPVSTIDTESPGITRLGPMPASMAAIIAGTIEQPSRVADNDPSNTYATIQKHGQVVATFDKSGGMMTPNGISIPSNLADGDRGTSLADARIKQMLAALGGDVVYNYP